MAYVLETITQEDQEKIIKDVECDERKRRALLARNGYFNCNPGLKWVIDRGRDSYLFWSPRPPMTQHYHYYFYFEKKTYAIHIESPVVGKVYFDDESPADPSLLSALKRAIGEAFDAHGIDGRNVSVSIAGGDK